MLDFQILQGQIIPLESEYYTQAMEISDRISDPTRQWQAYLNILALRSFTEWLAERAGDMRLDEADCSALQPELANLLEVVCNLIVGEFKVCLIATESLIDNLVRIPKAAIELPEFAAHFYVIMEVWEEEEQASIRGFVRYAQLLNTQESGRLAAQATGIYQLPLNLFDVDVDNLLLSLHLANPADFKLTQKDEVLSPSASCLLPSALQEEGIVEQAINVAVWLRDEIDEFARSLGWGIPVNLTPAVAAGWRSSEGFDFAIAQLINQGMEIPPEARGSCQSISVDEIPLQLFAAGWHLMAEDRENQQKVNEEWSLLLILKTQYGGFLPQGIKLEVADQSNILSEQVVETHNFYLGSCVVGNLDDQFFITITLNDKELKLPPFVFLTIPNY
ncbi:MAG: DUF1822 family protein [Symploca sp. SIO2C1]|nr:DUF1822 family protein [Symploca sp. SIO2C1]